MVPCGLEVFGELHKQRILLVGCRLRLRAKGEGRGGGRRRTIELNKKGSLIVHSISSEYVMYRVLIVHPNGRTSCNAIECPSVVPCLSPAVVEG